jgi:hypothetical protein
MRNLRGALEHAASIALSRPAADWPAPPPADRDGQRRCFPDAATPAEGCLPGSPAPDDGCFPGRIPSGRPRLGR